ncbi:MAG: OmpA family protein [Calditrichia bacterium]|nr:OmpA family protein [Calditrichia bacterium]
MRFGKILSISLVVLFSFTLLFGQLSNLESNLFKDAEKLKQELEVIQANILSPENYKEAIEAYNEAQTRYEKRKSLSSIEKLLDKFREKANEAKEVARTAKTIFASTLEIRNEALQFKANEAAEELFTKAEKKFKDASKNYEDNNLSGAKKKGKEAESLYKKASLKAINTSLLDEARIYLREGKNIDAQKYCPKIYFKARQLLQQVEEILNTNYKAGSQVQGLAEDATYQSKHAIVLTKAIRKLKDKDENWERLILMFEEVLDNISAEFNYEPKFNNDFTNDLKDAKEDIILSVQNLKNENLELKGEVKDLQEKIDEMQGKLSELQSTQQKVADELKAKKEMEAKILAIENQFDKSEALVFRSENKVVVRLYGLSFPSGKSDILPKYFQLLTRVQNAIRKLSPKQVIVEGHTDAIGNDSYNLNLSQLRTTSVQSYLIANMGVDESFIQADGFGKAKPVAPNDTAENRAKNRRIDVVLILKDKAE